MNGQHQHQRRRLELLLAMARTFVPPGQRARFEGRKLASLQPIDRQIMRMHGEFAASVIAEELRISRGAERLLLLEALRLAQSPALVQLAIDNLPDPVRGEGAVLVRMVGDMEGTRFALQLLNWAVAPPVHVDAVDVIEALRGHAIAGRCATRIRSTMLDIIERDSSAGTYRHALITLSDVPGARTRAILTRLVDNPKVGEDATRVLAHLGGVDRIYFGRDYPLADAGQKEADGG
jgi:hypothetical protein